MNNHHPDIRNIAAVLNSARHIVFFTGAGISAESGIPTFRDRFTGLWENIDPATVATPQAFLRNPEQVWRWHFELLDTINRASPNRAHQTIAALQGIADRVSVITQNIDGLHQLAGSCEVIELHGNIHRVKGFCDVSANLDLLDQTEIPSLCPACCGCSGHPGKWPYDGAEFELNELRTHRGMELHCPYCGGWLRPDIVWFNEFLQPEVVEQAWSAVESCDVLISVGASLLVEPASDIPVRAKRHGAQVIEINTAATKFSPFADIHLQAPAAVSLPMILDAMRLDSHGQ